VVVTQRRRGGAAYLVVGADSCVGGNNFGVGTDEVGVGIGVGRMMITFGGPLPAPSCANATDVVAADKTKRAIVTHLIVILLGDTSARRRRREYAVRRPTSPFVVSLRSAA
jgi:hypothetical protein